MVTTMKEGRFALRRAWLCTVAAGGLLLPVRCCRLWCSLGRWWVRPAMAWPSNSPQVKHSNICKQSGTVERERESEREREREREPPLTPLEQALVPYYRQILPASCQLVSTLVESDIPGRCRYSTSSSRLRKAPSIRWPKPWSLTSRPRRTAVTSESPQDYSQRKRMDIGALIDETLETFRIFSLTSLLVYRCSC